MTTDDQQLLQEAQLYVTDFFATRVSPVFVFHNIDHTREVVKAVELLADHYDIPSEDRLPLLLAAWFHDTGYSGGEAKNHEEASKRIATRFLMGHNVDNAIIEKVSVCIMATKMPQTPGSLIEQILCDADLYHLSSDKFAEKGALLRKELNMLLEKKIGKKEWHKENIRFVQQHKYFTDYARAYWEPTKQQNLIRLLTGGHKKEKEQDEKPAPVKTNSIEPSMAESISLKEKIRIAKEKQGRTERSISTMFRIMTNNHVNLSHMADSKANIMISVNTIVISILVSVLTGKLQFYPEFIVPTIILLCVCLAAIVCAILATRPTVNRGTFTREDIKNKKVNLLFFGNFYNMSLPEYDWAMKEMMSDHDYLNSSMIKDIYFLGVVLARKYKFLRLSYNIFMFGIIIGIVAFSIAFLFSQQGVG